MLGKIEDRKRKGDQRIIRWLDGITDRMDMNLGKFGEMVRAGRPDVHPWGHKESDTIGRLNNNFIYLQNFDYQSCLDNLMNSKPL